MTFAGYGLITVTVTSLDGSSEQTYRVLGGAGQCGRPPWGGGDAGRTGPSP